ncbi:MAG: hypothetical protein Q9164_002721 [Protoblastenia rupestris]
MSAVEPTDQHPEYDLFVGSYNRWKLEEAREEMGLGDACFPLFTGQDLEEYGKKNSLPPVPEIIRILSRLPVIEIGDLEDDQRNCAICLEGFKYQGKAGDRDISGNIDEAPVRLRCGHVFGDVCFRNWIRPFGEATSCPMCRANHFPNRPGTTQARGVAKANIFELELDEAAWIDHRGGKPDSDEGRALLRCNRFRVAQYRVSRAYSESYRTAQLRSTWDKTRDWRERGAEIWRMTTDLKEGMFKFAYDQVSFPGMRELIWRAPIFDLDDDSETDEAEEEDTGVNAMETNNGADNEIGEDTNAGEEAEL